MKQILIAGVGNIFNGDDAFGVEMARQLMQCNWPAAVRIVDFGIRSYDLAYALTEGYDAIILVDATSRGEPPGTLYLIKPDLKELETAEVDAADAHSSNPMRALQMAEALGGRCGQVYLIGCEPAVLETEDGHLGLSEPVRAAVPRAIEMIRGLIEDLLRKKQTMKPNLVQVENHE